MAYHGNHPITHDLLHDRQVKRVLERHAQIEEKLHEEMKAPLVDWDGIRLLKAQKLRLVDELNRLKQMKQLH